ncbi:DoxX family protein [Rhodococcus sp. NPDC058521]|uniref:DoxX family protein n=1 Tax=Rhodococcus sp. NPDC058521 TaxID=3346536 RepID=UPI00365451DA
MPKDPSKSSPSDGLPSSDDELDFGDTAGGGLPTEQIPTYSAMSEQSEQYVSQQPTEILSAPAPATSASDSDFAATPVSSRSDEDESDRKSGRGTLDLGLLCLRVAVGAIALVHGLQKLVGLWDGPGLDGFESTLADAGFDHAKPLAILGAVGEVAGGALLILGLLTPFAAASVLAVMINAWAFRQIAAPGLEFFAPAGTEYETLLGVCAGVIILTGPGRISFDGRRGWATRPFVGSFVVLLLGIAAGVCTWIFLNGANPLI